MTIDVFAAEYERVMTTIPDVNPVGLLPVSADYIRTSAYGLTLGGTLGMRPFPFPVLPGFTNTPIIANVDTVDHNFLFFLRDGGALNLPLNVTPVTIVAGASGQLVNMNHLLLPGQRLEVEMQEVVVTTAPNLSNFSASYLVQPFDVCGYEIGNQADVINNTPTTSVLTAPADRRRIVLSSPFLQQSHIFNRDTVAHAVSFTHSVLGVVNNLAALAADGSLPSGGTVILEPGESLTAATATATTTTDPYAIWSYVDVPVS